MNKHDLTRAAFNRVHGDLFGQEARYVAEFYNYSAGDYNPDTGQLEGETKSLTGSANVETVPPAQDSTISIERGSDVDWSTSIRFPEQTEITSEFKPLGVDNERPTEVEITDQKTDTTETFELHSYTTEIGSGMIMCRLMA